MIFMLGQDGELSHDVEILLRDSGNLLYMSAASIRELYAAWYKYKWIRKRWKTPQILIEYIQDELFIEILYPQKEHYDTFRKIEWNIEEDHRDSTDIFIIAHAITNRLPLISSDRRFKFYTKQGLDFIYNKR